MNSNVGDIIQAVYKDVGLGKEIVTTLSGGAIEGIPVLPTGIPQLDVALGVGGLPQGRIIEIYGGESSGKTTLALKCMAQAQRVGWVGGYVDLEHALDPAWAKKNGVDTDNMLLSQPDCGEDGLTVAASMIKNGCKFVVVDSVAALVPKAEIEGDFGDSHMGLVARLMGQGMRKLAGIVKKKGAIVIFINQIRMKIGIVFGNPETTPGGNALKFFSSIRMEIRKSTKITAKGGEKEDDKKADVLGNNITIKIVKNKVAPPFKMCEAILTYENGLDTWANLFEMMIDRGAIEKKGSWYAYKNNQLGQGKPEALLEFLNLGDKKLEDLYDYHVNKALSKE